jgi:hypothetical protein
MGEKGEGRRGVRGGRGWMGEKGEGRRGKQGRYGEVPGRTAMVVSRGPAAEELFARHRGCGWLLHDPPRLAGACWLGSLR